MNYVTGQRWKYTNVSLGEDCIVEVIVVIESSGVKTLKGKILTQPKGPYFTFGGIDSFGSAFSTPPPEGITWTYLEGQDKP